MNELMGWGEKYPWISHPLIAAICLGIVWIGILLGVQAQPLLATVATAIVMWYYARAVREAEYNLGTKSIAILLPWQWGSAKLMLSFVTPAIMVAIMLTLILRS